MRRFSNNQFRLLICQFSVKFSLFNVKDFDMAYGNQEFLAEVGVQLFQVYKLYGKKNAFAIYLCRHLQLIAPLFKGLDRSP